MERYHEEALTRRLETVADEGCAHVFKNELRRWYGGKKLAVRTYRNLEDRWQEITENEHGPLKAIAGAGGFFLLAGDRINLVSDEVEEE